MRCILPFLALAACSPQPAARARPGALPAAPPAAATPAPTAAQVSALVPHLAPGDPVTLAVRLASGAVTRMESLEATIARPDGTTRRAPAVAQGGGPGGFAVDLAPGDAFSLAGRYRVSLAGAADGRRFASREVEIEVVADGRLPLAEIERRARVELARRRRVTAEPAAAVNEEPGGDRAVRLRAGGAVYVVRLSPAGAVRGVESEPTP